MGGCNIVVSLTCIALSNCSMCGTEDIKISLKN